MATLRSHEQELRRRGVQHAALFGPVARGDALPTSDVDILTELDPAAPVDMLDYAGIKHYIAGLFPGPADVVDRAALKPALRPGAAADAVYAF